MIANNAQRVYLGVKPRPLSAMLQRANPHKWSMDHLSGLFPGAAVVPDWAAPPAAAAPVMGVFHLFRERSEQNKPVSSSYMRILSVRLSCGAGLLVLNSLY